MIDQTTPRELFEKTCWYACRTKSGAENKVQQQLSRAGFEAYLPGVEEEWQWADRKSFGTAAERVPDSRSGRGVHVASTFYRAQVGA